VNYEAGTRHPAAQYLTAVADAGVDVAYVLTGERGANVQLSGSNLPKTKYGKNLSDDVFVPISNVAASMGYGRSHPGFEQVIGYAQLSRSWIRSELPYITSTNNLGLLPVVGDSMSPTFDSGDLLIIDLGINAVRDDAIYAFSLGDDLFVKRMIRNPITKSITAKSDNELHGSFEIGSSHVESLRVHGRIVYRWLGSRL